MKIGSAFSGCAGTESHLSDHDILYYIENNKWANANLKYKSPEVPNYGDINEVKISDLPYVDLFLFGSPCQDISISGKREGLTGSRSGLFFRAIEIIKKKKPKYFIFENVKGLFNSQKGWDFGKVVFEMATSGYDLQWSLLSASDFGVPQARERIYITGYNRKEGGFKSLSKEFDIGEASKEGSTKRDVFNYKNKKIKPLPYSKSTREKHIDHRVRLNNIFNTLSTGDGCSNKSTANFVFQNKKIRKLSPSECESLMSWVKGWTEFGIMNNEKVRIPDKERYRMCGNGVVGVVIKSIVSTFKVKK